MAKRKTVEQQIAEAMKKVEQEQNALKALQDKQKEQRKKVKENRYIKRHGQLETLLPDTAILSDELFKIFLEQHIANSHGKRKLAELMKLHYEANPHEKEEETAQGDELNPSKTAEAEQGEKKTAPAGEKHNNGNTPKNNPHNAGANATTQEAQDSESV
jgi:hypothetical protein